MDGPWMLRHLLEDIEDPREKSNLGIALPPGPPFLGGSNLVIWRFIENERLDAAMRLLKHLVSEKVQTRVTDATGHLPGRKALLNQPKFKRNPHYRMLLKAQQSGRRPPFSTLWGQLENSLTNACFSIWRRLKIQGNTEKVHQEERGDN